MSISIPARVKVPFGTITECAACGGVRLHRSYYPSYGRYGSSTEVEEAMRVSCRDCEYFCGWEELKKGKKNNRGGLNEAQRLDRKNARQAENNARVRHRVP